MARVVLAFLAALGGSIVVLPVVILGLPFWLMAAGVRLFARATEPRLAAKEELMQFHPALAWKPRPDLNAHYLIRRDDIYAVATDSEGWPGRTSLDESEIVVVGDSFAYGYGARRGEAFWELDSELKIKPVGCPGYDMVQEVEALRQLGSRLAGKLVCWLIYLENDIADSVRPNWRGYRKPFVRRSRETGQWEVFSDHVRQEPWVHSTERANMRIFSALCSPGPLADHFYSACRFLIEEAAAICRAARAELVVVTVPNMNQLDRTGRRHLMSLTTSPHSFNPDYPDVRLARICDELRLPFVPAKGRLLASDYKRFERFHWNARGHRKMAGLLRELSVAWKSGMLRPDPAGVKPPVPVAGTAIQYVS
jgi:hypothetical protein